MINIIFLYFLVDSVLTSNVLFIVVDDLRPALGSYGDKNAYTPNIDQLAEKGIVFNHAYAQQSLCAPSRTSFLTSRTPDTLRLYDFYSYWRDSAGNYTTLPQLFKENGYRTHSIGKVFHPGASSNWTDDYPYSWTYKPYHPSTEQYKEAHVCMMDDGVRARNLVCPVTVKFQPEGTLPDLQSLDEAVAFLENQENEVENEPYFLAVGFHKPHIPLKFPRKYLDLHPLENVTVAPNRNRPHDLPNVAWNPWTDVRRRDDIDKLNISFPFGQMPQEWTERITQNYHAAVSYIDDLIGQLLEKVDDDTVIVIIGDHGWSLGEHGEWSKFSNYEVATRVPFILYTPTIDGPITVEEPVQLLDIFPTLVEITNITPSIPRCDAEFPDSELCTEGISLLPLIRSYKKDFRSEERCSDCEFENLSAFSQYPRPGLFPTKSPNSDKPRLREITVMGYTMRTRSLRYTEWVKFDNAICKADCNVTYSRELYNHDFDVDENINLVSRPGMDDLVQTLSAKLRTERNFCL